MKKLGFGFMRLPQNSEDVTDINYEELNRMVDTFMERGFNYFDTGYHYHAGASEEAIRKSLVERYPRESFILADKIPLYALPKQEELEPIFQEQLERCGVEYFDYYLMHNICKFSEKAFTEVDSFTFVKEKLEEGKIRHMGISYHDTAQMLDDLLRQHPEIEFVQLQINYYDWENDSVQARKCYQVCQKHDKPVIVMEPVKGGTLVNLSDEADKLMKEYDSEASIASWAIRYCASLDDVMMVLSGMTDYQQLDDNTTFMDNFKPINDTEEEIIEQVVEILKRQITVDCTKCNYCIDYCPKNINIPKLFDLYNTEMFTKPVGFSAQGQYYRTYAKQEGVGIASECIECGACKEKCPQHLNIPEYLKEVAKTFEISRYGFK